MGIKSYDVSAVQDAIPLIAKLDEVFDGEPVGRVAIALMAVSATFIRSEGVSAEEWTKDIMTMEELSALGGG
jgi:hypothetical protein